VKSRPKSPSIRGGKKRKRIRRFPRKRGGEGENPLLRKSANEKEEECRRDYRGQKEAPKKVIIDFQKGSGKGKRQVGWRGLPIVGTDDIDMLFKKEKKTGKKGGNRSGEHSGKSNCHRRGRTQLGQAFPL